eukprot:RCo009678
MSNFKIIVIGDSGVGKSCLTLRACADSFDAACPPTMGADFRLYTSVVEGNRIIAQIWDTAGQEIYADMCRAYYRGANGVLICYDITSRRSFDRVVSVWLAKMRDFCDQGIPCVLVGTKADLQSAREVTEQEASVFAATQGMSGHMETSARTSLRVAECFDWIIQEVYQQQKKLLSRAAALGSSSVIAPPQLSPASAGADGVVRPGLTPGTAAQHGRRRGEGRSSGCCT